MEKTYKHDIIRKNTAVGDVKLTLHADGRQNKNIVFVSCYDPNNGEVIYTKDDYIDGMDKEKHIDEFGSICPLAKIILVDGEMFSWYGSRLLKAPDYFRKLLKQL